MSQVIIHGGYSVKHGLGMVSEDEYGIWTHVIITVCDAAYMKFLEHPSTLISSRFEIYDSSACLLQQETRTSKWM
ncbi:unnamed protein product [Periconia digitata]|uniref:Uncharacterized protein n=1 Tax=Periconia digitata TaxID=1303443 RepID=A0A9W4UG59_9PLEO|nr:unnamed protein product [Periconia digitata]